MQTNQMQLLLRSFLSFFFISGDDDDEQEQTYREREKEKQRGTLSLTRHTTNTDTHSHWIYLISPFSRSVSTQAQTTAQLTQFDAVCHPTRSHHLHPFHLHHLNHQKFDPSLHSLSLPRRDVFAPHCHHVLSKWSCFSFTLTSSPPHHPHRRFFDHTFPTSLPLPLWLVNDSSPFSFRLFPICRLHSQGRVHTRLVLSNLTNPVLPLVFYSQVSKAYDIRYGSVVSFSRASN
ncbi:MAG: hypothetical protein JOS17DRAFT_739730 [Linnemannia elongata]|nr:MAG: hypothetical protein JOS17DRAFT_739730 [Linnemannia elongata]